jgi:Protein of unknown function (DUF1453)
MTPQDLQAYLPYVVVLIVLLLRMRSLRKPRRVRPEFLWVWPLVICLAGGFFAFGAYMKGGPLTLAVVLGVVIGLTLGSLAGWYRARAMHLHRDPETGNIMMRMSIEGLIFLVVLMLVRTIVRKYGGADADQFGAVADGLMACIVGLLVTRSIVIWRRCRALPPHQPMAALAD